MQRYAPRLIPAGSAPKGALVEPLIENPPSSPLGEHELIPQVAWMVERDGTFVHVDDSERAQLEVMRGSAELTKLDGELSNEALDDLPGVNIATNGEYAAELLFDHDHLAALHDILGFKVYLAAAPRRGGCSSVVWELGSTECGRSSTLSGASTTRRQPPTGSARSPC
jgi:hypothetical protein